jgi:hypothetical protein
MLEGRYLDIQRLRMEAKFFAPTRWLDVVAPQCCAAQHNGDHVRGDRCACDEPRSEVDSAELETMSFSG